MLESMISTMPPPPDKAPRLGYKVFDIEIHCMPTSLAAVGKYLPNMYRPRFEASFSGAHPPNFDQRGGNIRHDTDVSDGGPPASNPALIRRQLLDPFDIEWGICTGLFYTLPVYPDPDYAAAVASAHNDWMFNEMVAGDPAFLGAITIAPQNVEKSVKEIQRWANHPKAVEVFMSTAGPLPLGHRSLHPIYEAAAAHKLPVAAHTTVEGKGNSGPHTGAGYASRYLEYHTGLASTSICNTASLVCEGVFEKFPDFQFVLLEGGVSWVLPLMWGLDAHWKQLRQEMPQLRELPSTYLKRQMFYTTQPIEEPGSPRDLIQTYEQIGGQTQIMFSSDYPHWDFDNPFVILPGSTAADLKRRILRENAMALYGHRLPSHISEGTSS
jgi:predicted TIM-barrel fold metal-dependent hydrolase